MDVVIPNLAYDMIGLPRGGVRSINLMTGEQTTLMMAPDAPTTVQVGARDAVVMKIRTLKPGIDNNTKKNKPIAINKHNAKK